MALTAGTEVKFNNAVQDVSLRGQYGLIAETPSIDNGGMYVVELDNGSQWTTSGYDISEHTMKGWDNDKLVDMLERASRADFNRDYIREIRQEITRRMV